MKHCNVIDDANLLAVQRLLSNYFGDLPRYTSAMLAGATIHVEPTRHRTHVPKDAEARRYVVTVTDPADQMWSAVVRAVWRDGRLFEPQAVHVAIEQIDALDGAPDDVAALRMNSWLRSLDL